MAIRYCGTLILGIRYERKTGDYTVRVRERNDDIERVLARGVHPLTPRFATESADAYDSVARAALCFHLDPFVRSYGRHDDDGYAVERRDPMNPEVERVPLNKGGYTRTGMYFGVGEKLWRFTLPSGYDRYLRAPTKADAVARARGAL